MKQKIYALLLSIFTVITVSGQPSRCIDLGVGVSGGNGEYFFIDNFKGQATDWTPSRYYGNILANDSIRTNYRVYSLNTFKIVNGAYWNWDRDWSNTVNNQQWGNNWFDCAIEYEDMAVDQGKMTPTGYPVQIPYTLYEYKSKLVDPSQGIDLTKPITIKTVDRRIYFPEGFPTDGWVMKWKGKGKISFEGITAITQTSTGLAIKNNGNTWPGSGGSYGYNMDFTTTAAGVSGGRIVVNHVFYVNGRLLTISNSDPTDPIRDIVFLYPGMEALYDSGEELNPKIIEKLSLMKNVRYMGYMSANGMVSRTGVSSSNPYYISNYMKELTWDERTKHNELTYNNGNGGAHEYVVMMANKTKTDVWLNIPYCAGEDYVKNMVKFYMDNLDKDRTLRLELGNELWNFGSGFQGYRWLANMRPYYYPGLGDVEARGQRLNQVFTWIKQAAGATNMSRIQRIVGAFPEYFDVNNRTIMQIDQGNWDALATTWYFGLTQNPLSTVRSPDPTKTYRKWLYDWWVANPGDQLGFNAKYKEAILGEFNEGKFSHGTDLQLAKSYGKKLVAYEGGNHTLYGCTNEAETPPGNQPSALPPPAELQFLGGTYPQYVTDNGFIFRIAEADKSPEVGEIYQTIIDTMRTAGMQLANHLSLAGRSSCYGVWNLFDDRDLDEDVAYINANYPKFKTFTDIIKNENCRDFLINIPTTNEGAGLAVKIDGFDDYIDVSSIVTKPSDAGNYTIETWAKAYDQDTIRPIFSLVKSAAPNRYNYAYVRQDGRLIWEIANGGTVNKVNGPVITLNKWTHFAFTKNGSRYSLYINGKDVASINTAPTGATYDLFSFGALVSTSGVSYAFRGEMDEIKTWNYARTDDQIRNYMCKKVAIPASETGLIINLRFDNGNNEPITPNYTNTLTGATLSNVTFTERSSYLVSGAPIGDISAYTYATVWTSVNLMSTHPDGDFVGVSNMGAGTPDGVHIYWINGQSYYNDAPVGYIGAASNKQFGVFMANGNNPAFDLTYKFDGNSAAPGPYTLDQVRLIKKLENSTVRWEHAGAKIDKTAKTLVILCKETDKSVYNIGYRNDFKRPGAGKAIKYYAPHADGLATGQARYLPPFSDYTITFWGQGTGWAFQTFRTAGSGGQDNLYVSNTYASSNINTEIRTDDSQGSQYTTSTAFGDSTRWYHYAVTRKGTEVTIFVNGVEVGKNNILRTYTYNGVKIFNPPSWAGYQGLSLDEFTVFNTALDQETIRDWMCKKMTREHPFACNLLLYFPFDEGAGDLLEDKFGAADMELTPGYFSYVNSGAALGDVSAHNYTVSSTVTLAHPNGDQMKADRISGANYGVHLYRVDNSVIQPSTITIPGIVALDSTRYWGLYSANAYNSTASYNMNYSYTGHAYILDETALRMLKRYDNADQSLQPLTQSVNTSIDLITFTGQTRGEYVLGGTVPGTFLYTKPATPVFLTVPSAINLKTVCGNSFGLKYAVKKDPAVVSYNWTLPAELTGFSTSDTIQATASYNGMSVKTVTISAVGVNLFGSSNAATYNVLMLPPPTAADAGPDLFLIPPVNAAVMDGNTVTGMETGFWKFESGSGTIVSINNPATSVLGFTSGTSLLTWNITQTGALCPATRDSLKVISIPPAKQVSLITMQPLPSFVCKDATLQLLAIPPDDITPDSYQWIIPTGFKVVTQTGNNITVLATAAGIGGKFGVKAVYAGQPSQITESNFLSIRPVSAKPSFINPPSVLCFNVPTNISTTVDPSIDSTDWEMPFGIYPVTFPKSSSSTINIIAIQTVSGYIVAKTYNNGCSSPTSADSFYVAVMPAPPTPSIYRTTDGGVADETCNDESIYSVVNPDPSVQYVWEWDAFIPLLEYFGPNHNAARFKSGFGNFNVWVSAVTTAIGCNVSPKFNVNAWNWNEGGYISDPVSITSPIGQDPLILQVGQTYDLNTTCLSCPTTYADANRWRGDFFWDAPEGVTVIDDGADYDKGLRIRVDQEFSGKVRVWAMTLRGCVKSAIELVISTPNGVQIPYYLAGNTTVCAGSMVNITVTNANATMYEWTLPRLGTVITTSSPVLSYVVPTPTDGLMEVRAYKNGVWSAKSDIPLRIKAVILDPTVFYGKNFEVITSLQVCEGDNSERVLIKDIFAREYLWNSTGAIFEFNPRFKDVDINDNGVIDVGETGKEFPRSTGDDTLNLYTYASWRSKIPDFLKVTSRNGCGGQNRTDSIPFNYAQAPYTQLPVFNTAPLALCIGSNVTYKVDPLPNVTQYVWDLPSGLSASNLITGSPEITVNVGSGTGGKIRVYGISPVCGGGNTSTQSTGVITISGVPVDFNFIQSPIVACPGNVLTYEVNNISVSGYTWNLPGGLGDVWVDNSDPSPKFTVINTGTGANWTTETVTGSNAVNLSNVWINNNTSTPKKVVYNFTVPGNGMYKVMVAYRSAYNAAPNVPVKLYYTGGNVDLILNESVGQWKNMGSYYFATSTTGIVEIYSQVSSNITTADALRIEEDGIFGGTTMSFKVQGTTGGPVCVTAPVAGCPSGYTICTPAVNLSGNLSNPTFITQQNTVCPNVDYTYSITNIGADSYTWILPPSWKIGSQSGTVTGLGSSVTITVGTLLGSNLVVRSFGVLTSCGLTFSGITSTNIINSSGCVLPAPMYTLEASNICEGFPYVYNINPVTNATSYLWQLPSGIVQYMTSLTGNVVTTVTSLTVVGYGSGIKDYMKVSSQAVGLNPSPFTNSFAKATIITNDVPSIIASQSKDIICSASETISFSTIISNGGTLPTYQWKLNGVNTFAGASTFIAGGFQNGDQVSVLLTSNAACMSPKTVLDVLPTITYYPAQTVTITSNIPALVANASTVIINATITGPPAYSLSWYKDGSLLYANSSILGVNSSSLTLTGVTSASNGTYVLVVNGLCSNLTTSGVTFAVVSNVVRYWVPGGDGFWSSSNNWSATSGGISGAGAPTLSDDAIFDANSGSGPNVTFTGSATVGRLTVTGVAINLYPNATANRTLSIGNSIAGTDLSVSNGRININSLVSRSFALILTANNTGLISNSYIQVNQSTAIGSAFTNSATTAELTFDGASIYNHNRNGGNVPLATWLTGSVCSITGITGTDAEGYNQSFSHFHWNCAAQSTIGNILHEYPTNYTNANVTISGDFIVQNTNNQILYIQRAITGVKYSFNNISILGGNVIARNGGSPASCSVTGNVFVASGATFSGSDFGWVFAGDNSSFTNQGTFNQSAITTGFLINKNAGQGLGLGSNLTVGATLVMNSGNVSINGYTLGLNNGLTTTTGMGTMYGGGSSSIVAASAGTIYLPSVANSLFGLTTNNRTINLTGDNTVTGLVSITGGNGIINAFTTPGVNILTMDLNSLMVYNRDGGAFPVANWNTGSTLSVVGWTGSTVRITPNGGNVIQNLVWDSPLQTNNPRLTSQSQQNLNILGTFSIKNTGSGILRLNNAQNENASVYINNFSFTGGRLYGQEPIASLFFSTTSVTIAGNYFQGPGTLFSKSDAPNANTGTSIVRFMGGNTSFENRGSIVGISIIINKNGITNELALSSDLYVPTHPTTVTSSLTINKGLITTGPNLVSVAGVFTGASSLTGWINGNIAKSLPAGNSNRLFEIGTAATYNPMTLTFSGLAAVSNIVGNVLAADFPSTISSCISGKSINRTWSLRNYDPGAIAGLNYKGNYIYNLATDADAGITLSNMAGYLFDGSNWSVYNVTATSANVYVSNQSVLGITLFAEKQPILTSSTITGIPAFSCLNSVPATLSVTPSACSAATTWSLTGASFTITGPNTISVVWTAPGQNVVQVTLSDGISNTLAQTTLLTISGIPGTPAFAVAPGSVCVNSSVSYVANTISGLNYNWLVNSVLAATSPSFTSSFSTPGVNSIRLTASNLCGTSNYVEQLVTITSGLGTPVFSYSTICNGVGNATVTQISGSFGGTFTSTADGVYINLNTLTGSASLINTSISGTFVIWHTFNSGGSCGSIAGSTLLQVNPIINLTTSGASICLGQSGSLSVSGANNYTWTGSNITSGGNSNNMIANPALTSIYTVSGISGSGCLITNTATLTVNSLPVLTTTSALICMGQSGSLTVTGANNYTWTGNNITAGINSNILTANPTVTSVYTISGSTAAGCVSTGMATLTVNTILITTPVFSYNTICNGVGNATVTTISGSFGGAYTSTAAGIYITINTLTGSASLINASITGTFEIWHSVNDGNGCGSLAGSALLQVNPTPALTTSGAALCLGENGILSVSGGNNYTWTGNSMVSGSNSSILTANPISTSVYTISGISSNGCLITNTAKLTINSLPGLSTLGMQICVSQSGNLTVSGANSYTWTGSNMTAGMNSNILTANPTITGVYTVSGSSAFGCISTSTATLMVNSLPTAGILSPLTSTVCGTGASASILSLTGYTGSIAGWEFNTGTGWNAIANTLPAYTANNLKQTTNYRVLVGSGACSNTVTTLSAIIVVQQPNAIPLTLSYNNKTHCIEPTAMDEPALFNVPGGMFVSIPTGLQFNTGDIVVRNSLPNTYQVTYSAPDGFCPNRVATVNGIVLKSKPVPASLGFLKTDYCNTETPLVTLDGVGGTFSIAVSQIPSTQIYRILNAPESGDVSITYTITATGCNPAISTVSTHISHETTLPGLTYITPVCLGTPIAPTESITGLGLLFSSSDLSVNNLGTANPTVAGTYAITYTLTGNGACSAKSSEPITVQVTDNKAGIAILETALNICEGNTAAMNVTLDNKVYQWQQKVENTWKTTETVSNTFTSDPLSATSYFRAFTVPAQGDVCGKAYTNVLTVTTTQLPKPGTTDSVAYTFCDNLKGELKLNNYLGTILWQESGKAEGPFSDLKSNTTDVLAIQFSDYAQTKYVRAQITNTAICPATFTGVITVTSCKKSDYVPNALTPNSSDLNSKWDLSGLKLLDEAEIKVFSRYGVEVYSASGKEVRENPWGGGNLAAGTYYYVIDRNDKKSKVQTGAVTIIK